jgi:lipopolysaccharide transport system ATP-binding protein
VVVVEFVDVWKYYPAYGQLAGGIKRFLFNLPTGLRELHKRRTLALEAISFTLSQGESLGIIGDNGAGKSTLLGLTAGVLAPTRGRVQVRGRVSALLELGAGFHPDLTGRENVVLNGVLLGLRRREVLERLDSIVAFAEAAEWIDQPTRTYSTGMVARLGFSVVAHLEPEILLIDEVLAVGDIRFQQKCVAKMHEFKTRGVTVMFVSHSLDDVVAVCQRAIWIDAHRIVIDGSAKEVVDLYRSRREAWQTP